mgnify:CR=1 FL=1
MLVTSKNYKIRQKLTRVLKEDKQAGGGQFLLNFVILWKHKTNVLK